MKPSQVVLQIPPLVGTFGRTETECTAALLVFCCQQLGDTWQAVGIDEIVALSKRALDHTLPVPAGEKWFQSFMVNPFIRTSAEELLNHPEWFTKHVDGLVMRFGFTDLGFELLKQRVPQ